MQWKKAHFIGIGGVGMSATAKLLRDAGVVITGSDEAVYPPISTMLEREGIVYKTPYEPGNIPADVDLIVIGKNAKLVPETNTEVAAAMQSGKLILSFPEVLAIVSEGKENIIVAGSYGKSTSTALLAHCLETANLAPSYFIGAVPLTPATSARMQSGNVFVLEGDEYPASNTDARSKFLLMQPQHLLVTPLAHDHFNIFPTPADYLKPFYELIKLAPINGSVVVCTEGALSKEFLTNIYREAITYGVHEGEFQAADIVYGETTVFSLMHKGTELIKLKTTQLGEHNIQNIVGVAALVLTRTLMTPEQFAAGVASFKGIKRRLDRKSEKTSIPIFEGFGSSYEKLHSAIAAMKQHFAARRLLVVFEPNTFSWRNRDSLKWYDHAFNGASKVYIFDAPHNDGKETQLSLEEIVARVRASGIDAVGVSTAEETLALLETDLSENDCVLLSSSGAMGGLIEEIPALAERRFPIN
jgi:UDP-N-acetylmuramate: L-alanyl-gamma-D-glutamyl-meso-diaminopimelate ligase